MNTSTASGSTADDSYLQSFVDPRMKDLLSGNFEQDVDCFVNAYLKQMADVEGEVDFTINPLTFNIGDTTSSTASVDVGKSTVQTQIHSSVVAVRDTQQAVQVHNELVLKPEAMLVEESICATMATTDPIRENSERNITRYARIPKFFYERVARYYKPKKHVEDALSEYIGLLYNNVKKAETDRDERKLVIVADGLFTKGNRAILDSHRYFFDTEREQLTRTTEFEECKFMDLYITKEMNVLPEHDILRRGTYKHNKCVMALTVAGPGCGKTTKLALLAKNCSPENTLVLTATRAGAGDLHDRLDGKYTVRTLDSFLMSRDDVRCDVLLMDEVFLSHPGKLQLAIDKSRCSVAHGYGDYMQIPFIDRSNYDCTKNDLLPFFPVCEFLTHSFRCPAEVCAVLTPYYQKVFGLEFKLTSDVASRTMYITSAVAEYTRFEAVLTFTQEDKYTMLSKHSKVFTVHEFQGGQLGSILVYIGENTPRNLLQSTAHAIVAISRHTRVLCICTNVRRGVLVEMVERGNRLSDDTLVKYMRLQGGARWLLAPEQPIFRKFDDPYDIVAVPRISSSNIPPYWKHHRTLLIRRGGSSNEQRIAFTSGKHATMFIPTTKKYCNANLSRVFGSHDFLLEGRYVLYDSATFEKLSPHLVVRSLNRFGVLGVRVISTHDHLITKEVSDFSITNVLHGMGEQLDITYPELTIQAPETSMVIPSLTFIECKTYVQDMMLNIFGAYNVYTDTQFDDFMFHTSDVHINIDQFKMTSNINELMRPFFARMTPMLSTPCPRSQAPTPRHALWSIMKRNKNVPRLTSVDDTPSTASRMVDRIFELCPTLCTDSIDLSPESIQDWLDDQPETVRNLITAGVVMENTCVDEYKFQIKPSPKPDLTMEALMKHPAVQTILSQSKDINAFFCPAIRIVRDRLLSSMARQFKFYTKVDDETFAEELTDDFPPVVAKNFKALEFDMSKYDKSQGELILEFECQFFLRVGLPPRLVDLWRTAHAITKARDPTTRISFETRFQRKSGDAATYLGNTLCLFAAITDVIAPEDIMFGAFSGDDSLIFVEHNLEIDYSILSTRYNFEVKLFDFKYHYFCSKYIIDLNNVWFVVPDPAKRAIKMGRHDLVNEEHVEEYRVSLSDNVVVYDNLLVAEQTSLAMQERHDVTYNFVNAIMAIKQLSSREYFHMLFERPMNGIICEDPSRPKLEL